MHDQVTQLILLGCLQYILFVIAITFHEAAHAWAAYIQGDYTAYYHGQVTLNPLPHLQREPIGAVLIPILWLAMTKCQNTLGWASTPLNPSWVARYPKKAFIVAMAGPHANLLLAVMGFSAMKMMVYCDLFDYEMISGRYATHVLMSQPSTIYAKLFAILFLFSYMNFRLWIFNLIPLHPFDGSWIWRLVLKPQHYNVYVSYAYNPNFMLLGYVAACGLMMRFLDPMLYRIYTLFMWGY